MLDSPQNQKKDSMDSWALVARLPRHHRHTVPGKAIKYIRALRKQEMRLKRQQDGLKALVSGLVGGSAPLHTWEKECREKFGGEEKDQVDALNIDLPESDDEDNDEEERRRKKPKVEVPSPPPTTSVPAGPPVVPRRRGRPREVMSPVAPAEKIGEKSLSLPSSHVYAPPRLLIRVPLPHTSLFKRLRIPLPC